MHAFDPLDWVHRYESYEMVMYVRVGETEAQDGIYMQVLELVERDGAQEWSILYDRRLADIPVVEIPYTSDAFEDKVLRIYLNEHPDLVSQEKLYIQTFERSEGEV